MKDEFRLEPALMSIEKACFTLDIGRSKLYELVHDGKLVLV